MPGILPNDVGTEACATRAMARIVPSGLLDGTELAQS